MAVLGDSEKCFECYPGQVGACEGPIAADGCHIYPCFDMFVGDILRLKPIKCKIVQHIETPHVTRNVFNLHPLRGYNGINVIT